MAQPNEQPAKRRFRRARRAPENASQSLEQLRRAIVGPEQSRIGKLEERDVVTPAAVSKVLPGAAAELRGEEREELAVALEPVMTSVVGHVARRQPEVFIEVLTPSIGAAVKKALSEALSAMMDRFNLVLERSMSFRSIRWRFEALRTGRPFAEVVLLRTLKYRVEQVFLIHTPTSLVLQHVAEPALGAQPADQIAAMLSAVDSFGREALGPLPHGAHLDKFQFGDLSVWVTRSAVVTIAAVVRGAAGSDFSDTIAEARTRIEVAHHRAFERFSGDTAPFGPARPELELLLQTKLVTPPRRAHIWLSLISAVLLLGGVAFWSRGHARHAQEAELRAKTLEVLAAAPGIVVTGVEWTPEHHRITGLVDPLAPRPGELIQEHGLPPVETVFSPFLSLDPRIVARRNAIEIEKAAEELRYAAASLDEIVVPFDRDQTKIDPAAEPAVFHAATEAENALHLAALEHRRACIEVDGHADASGDYGRNLRLSGARAREVRRQLEAMGVEHEAVLARGAGITGGDSEARSATLHLVYGDAAKICGVTP